MAKEKGFIILLTVLVIVLLYHLFGSGLQKAVDVNPNQPSAYARNMLDDMTDGHAQDAMNMFRLNQ
ncbi:hypothetical protein PP175_28515 (plasmid) [Aneurinibacillus sp. Ricciae_BoGa-3]|uniref:hypothetical protein n=1 Tax=Aneurinibacillus sp. Ricciae_BoGa-3 TaxID=3022697 RepID=UPI00234194E5|nr:hypothetical protein [Aneurinibacillus sp. Ricciae_BoGa-3]WCK57135.1 hypothetical protein PP175_28515 [Aneurinibacillus sp. Ricciae_BoGa-3]